MPIILHVNASETANLVLKRSINPLKENQSQALNNCKFCSSNIQSINIRRQAGEGLLGSIRAVTIKLAMDS